MLSALVCNISSFSIFDQLANENFPIALIVYRIWGSRRLIEAGRKNAAFLPLMVMVIESGAIYSSGLIAVVVTYTSGNKAQYIILDFVRSGSLSVCVCRVETLNHIILFV